MKGKDLIGWVCGGVSLSVSGVVVGVEMLVKPIFGRLSSKKYRELRSVEEQRLALWLKLERNHSSICETPENGKGGEG